MILCNTQSISDWLYNTQSRVLKADLFIFENNEKATWNTKMPHYSYSLPIINFRKFKHLNDFGEVLL